MIRSRVSFAHVTSFGRSSAAGGSTGVRTGICRPRRVRTCDHFRDRRLRERQILVRGHSARLVVGHRGCKQGARGGGSRRGEGRGGQLGARVAGPSGETLQLYMRVDLRASASAVLEVRTCSAPGARSLAALRPTSTCSCHHVCSTCPSVPRRPMRCGRVLTVSSRLTLSTRSLTCRSSPASLSTCA